MNNFWPTKKRSWRLPLRILPLGVLLAGCAMMPAELDYEGCDDILISWALGPDPDEAFLDVCYADLDAELIRQAYQLVPIPGVNPDTRLVNDHNRDGISGNGAWNQGNIHWGGQSCQQYARRIRQKECAKIGASGRSYGCDWIALQVRPRPGIQSAQGKLQPVWRVRRPDGVEELRHAKDAKTIGFANCR